MFRPAVKSVVPMSLCVLLLAGCGSGEHADKGATQVAARVNKDEISVHQINMLLQRARGLSTEQAKQAGAQILEGLIDQELLVQKAVEDKLDRDPRVVQAMDAARREILAQAYRDKVVAAAGKPDAQAVGTYYAAHPELFAERRIYAFRELALEAKPETVKHVQEQLAQGKSLQDIGAWLKQENIPFAVNATTKPAEQLPLQLVARFHKMKDGQIGVIPSAGRIVLMQLAASSTAPLDEKQAAPLIEQYLEHENQLQLAQAEIKRLRGKAKIEYMGEFSRPEATAAVAGAPAVSAPSTALARPPAPAVAAPGAASAAEAKSATADFMSKGITGLK